MSDSKKQERKIDKTIQYESSRYNTRNIGRLCVLLSHKRVSHSLVKERKTYSVRHFQITFRLVLKASLGTHAFTRKCDSFTCK